MSAVEDTTMALVTQRLLQEGRPLDALGVYWIAGPCTCSDHAAGLEGWSIITVQPGLQLHYCGSCGRGARPNREDVLGAEPWRKGDVALYDGVLVELTGEPGPTGVVRVRLLDAGENVHAELSAHVAQLNLEE
jgi:hypothetical protein